jgi:DNA-binding MarR family transcriptional regulator
MEKTSKQLERYCKGAASYRRIEILGLLAKKPNLSLDQIAFSLKANMKTVSNHTHRLAQAGLIRKYRSGMAVAHSLSPFGEKFNKFLKTFK